MTVDIAVDSAHAPAVMRELKSVESVRSRAERVYALGVAHKLDHFDLATDKIPAVAQYVVDIIRRDYAAPTDVPPHSRWRHFDVGGVARVTQLLGKWAEQGVSTHEQARRLLDLFVVSVLLDAGAGSQWTYHEASTGKAFGRSEGLAVASLDMFLTGLFSSDAKVPHQVDAQGLSQLTADALAQGFQVATDNPMVGLEGRCQLLQRLGQCLLDQPIYFPPSTPGQQPRPGDLLDYLVAEAGGQSLVPVTTLWDLVINGLAGVWPPTRTLVNGQSMGDVWVCPSLRSAPGAPPSVDQLVCFHKLSQWLTYSLMEPITQVAGLTFQGVELLTGLPEYRNGGLFVDLGVLTLKEADKQRGLPASRVADPAERVPTFAIDDPVVAEWRALTVVLLDQTAAQVREILKLTPDQLPLAQVLEGGTWKAGREIAAKYRPKTRGPPIAILSDGTVF
ncbi:hypothetical protein H4R35_000221 [Dimargaris xerosporica]|nr:hypothetical protein H4R35_000221 [Dimargaris xerosporica]